MFGQPNKPLFGGATGTPGFGTATTSTFGAGTAFGTPQQQQQSTSLFGSPSTSGFGTGLSMAGGTSIFGGQPTGAQSIFGGGGQMTQSPFGTQTGASTPFGQPAVSSVSTGGLFSTAQPSTGLTFGGGTGGFGTGGFGTQQAPIGTSIKFIPVSGTDNMLKNGANQTINTKLLCITAMKEYESKSIDELRFEDYSIGRKGQTGAMAAQSTGFGTAAPTQSTFGGGLFGQQPATSTQSTFGATSTGLFGQQPQTPAFGTGLQTSTSQTSLFGGFNKPTTGFGGTSTGTSIFGQPSQPQQTGIFGQPTSTASVFGQPQQATPFSFGNTTQNTAKPPLFGSTPQQPQQQTGIFGQQATGFGVGGNQQSKPTFAGFNTTATTPAFGSTGFGGTSAPAQPSFNFGAAAATSSAPSFFGGQQQQTGGGIFSSNVVASKPLFSATTPSTGFGVYGTNTGGGIFNTSTSGGLFGSTPSVGFGTTTTPAFGATGFGGATTTTTTSMFPQSSTQQQPTMFGGLNTTPFQNTATPFSFGTPSSGMSLFPSQQSQWNTNNHDLLARLKILPYGTSPLFQNDLSNVGAETVSKFTTDIKTLNQYKMSIRAPETKRIPVLNGTDLLFNDVDDDDGRLSAQDILQPRKNVKKLVLKPKNPETPTANSSFSQNSFPSPPSITEPKRIDDPSIENTVCELIRPSSSSENTPSTSRRGLHFSVDTLPPDEESAIDMTLNRSIGPPLKSGVILTRPDYYTIPKLEELDNFYSDENNTCILDSFTIGRKGYGTIYWPGPIDVQGLNIDEIVHIRRAEVIIYPDDDDKPPVGKGLNCPAQVTLDQVWPVDKNTNEVIRDINKLDQMRYSEKLERISLKQQAIFKDYRPETGSWVFKVKHFSKYGLLDDEDDQDVVMTGSTPQEYHSQQQSVITRSPSKKSTEPKSHYPDISSMTEKQPQQPLVRPITSFTTQFEQMLMDFPRPEDYVFKGPMRGVEETLNKITCSSDYFGDIRSVLFDDDLMTEEHDKPIVKKQKQYSAMPSCAHQSPSLAESFAVEEGSRKPKVYHQVSLPVVSIRRREMKFLVNPFIMKHRLITDISSVKNPSVPKVRFISGSRLFTSVDGNVVNFFEVATLADITGSHSSSLEERFQVQLQSQTIIRSHPSLIPYAAVKGKSTNAFNPTHLNDLVVALFGDVKDVITYEFEEQRRSSLIDWLCQYNRKKFPLSSTVSSLDKILFLLTVNDIKTACEECLKQNLPRLSLLLSAATCTQTKDECLNQLDSWKRSGADAFISKSLLRLYILVGGAITWTTSTGIVVSPLEQGNPASLDLSWSQSLALRLVYYNDIPLRENIHLTPSSSDIEYQIITNYANEEGDMWPALDYCSDDLEAWFVHQTLQSFGAIGLSSKSDVLHSRVASQLMAQGVRWATFVALHIGDDNLRSQVVKEVISANCKNMSEEDEQFLTKRLLIPEGEVASLQAISHRYSFDYNKTCQALLRAGKWVHAHDLLVDKIFPDLVINDETTALNDILNVLRPHCSSIPSWYTSGAYVYDIYMRSLRKEEQVLQMLEKNPIDIAAMKCPSNKHSLAQSEMAHKITLFCSSISSGGDAASFPLIDIPLPDDYALAGLRQSAFHLLSGLVM